MREALSRGAGRSRRIKNLLSCRTPQTFGDCLAITRAFGKDTGLIAEARGNQLELMVNRVG
ncbi:hypothetical protein MPC1_9910002 [Methylocella tundrae]|nr:hypothetical protein MPC1_9910002 [Methylocella tundrae]